MWHSPDEHPETWQKVLGVTEGGSYLIVDFDEDVDGGVWLDSNTSEDVRIEKWAYIPDEDATRALELLRNAYDDYAAGVMSMLSFVVVCQNVLRPVVPTDEQFRAAIERSGFPTEL